MVKKNQEAEKENNERWLITYADLITLLLIFFIVLYSMSQINAQKFSELSQSMAIIFGQTGRSGVLDGGRSVMPDPSTFKERKNLSNTKEQIKRMIMKNGLEGKITVKKDSRGLVISIQDTIFFSKGSADLGIQAQDILTSVGQMLAQMPNAIRIEGHTDNIPIHTQKFYSNWELSIARATSVLHHLLNTSHIPPERLSASGYGEYKPIASNKSEIGRRFNRRVDIIIISEDEQKLEPPALSESTLEKSESQTSDKSQSISGETTVPAPSVHDEL
jgi:chemotaxis protein MotB